MAINYTESDYTKKYKEYLDSLDSSKPTTYESQYRQATQDSLDKLLNREKFQYDVNEDALWQQAKDRYIQQGRMAMQDTMGQAAAMTGGYGNSYAQGVGQQAYQGYLQQLNDSLPEYYQLAQDAYDAEGNRLKEQYGLLSDQESQEYDRYLDSWNQWQQEYQNAQSGYESGRSWDYGVAQDNAALAQTQVKYLISKGITPNPGLLAEAGYDEQYVKTAIKKAKEAAAAGSSSAYSGGGGSTSSSDDEIAVDFVNNMMQKASGKIDFNQAISGSNQLTDAQKKIAKEYVAAMNAAGK